MFSKSILSKLALTGVVSAAAVFVPGVVFAASFGPDRPTIKYTGPGTKGADHVVFNSFTNVPGVGDERQFFTGQVVGTGTYSDPVNAKMGDEVLVQVYVHNNASRSLNDGDKRGVAKDTKVRVDLPTVVAKDQQATAYISASNAKPREIFDTLNITSDQPYRLDYIEGSANIRGNHINTTLSDDLVNGGVTIGHKHLNGDFNGCFEFATYVTFKVKIAEAPKLSVEKSVRFEGQTKNDWTDTLKGVEVGDTVEYKITVLNQGKEELDGIIVGDNLPPYLEYVPGSDMIVNAGNPNGEALGNTVTTGGVILKDTYTGNGGGAHIILKAKVKEITENCGVLTLTNVGMARTEGTQNVEDTADIVVDSGKTCKVQGETTTPVKPTEPELPNTGPVSLLAALVGTGALSASIRNWVASRKALSASLLGIK